MAKPEISALIANFQGARAHYESSLEELREAEEKMKEARERMQEHARILREALAEWSGEALDGLSGAL